MHEPPGGDTPERRDWAKLPPDLAVEIGGRLLRLDLAEYTRFRAVCKPWRDSTDDPRALRSRFLPRDWVVLRNHNFSDEETRCHHLLNVATGASIAGVALPELSGHRPLGYAEGLLVLRNTTSSGIRLLNPLTRAVTDLPDISPVLGANASNDALDSAHFSWSFGVIDGGAASSPATVVLLLRNVPLLACIRLGDPRWAPVDTSSLAVAGAGAAKGTFQSVLSLHGRFYVTTSTGDILTVELHPEPRLVYVIRQATTATLPATSSYITLAPSSSDAGMIMLRAGMSEERGHPDVEVFEVDVDGGKLIPMATVGADRAVFVGSLRALSVSTRVFPSIAANATAVYFCIGQAPMFYVFHNGNWRGEMALEMGFFDGSEESSFGPSNLDVYLACCVDFLPGTM